MRKEGFNLAPGFSASWQGRTEKGGSVLVGESSHRDCSHHSRLGSRVSTRNQKPARCVFQRTARVTYSHQQGPASQSSPTKIKLPARDQVLKL